ncbi:FGGY-family carbohydrate kinase [Bacillus sp. FJAT-50079]|uniref:FGGY-family carbohydrate kinase n=1 Tax=Bacillus sp. FJAT-50079 TaxID=2833577 RepID=UPI001BC95C67|nr:FGGY-family carbohydrate kinase [Bacillus sp. FJAT-50079]MBS4210173.1 hypothetical protein [Bacillus sp. FJAT-50079]
MELILVIDIGTSSMRGVLYNQNGKIKKMIQIHYRPTYLSDERVEQDPLDWKHALIQITTEAVNWSQAQRFTINGISVTSQRTSIIPVNKVGEPLHHAIMWQDKRTYDICQELKDESEEVYKRTGSKINPVFTAPKITWLRRHMPDIYNAAHKIIVIPDYVIFLITGKFVTDYTYGSRSSLMNIQTMEWDEDLLELFEVDREKLSELVQQGSVVGYATKEFSDLTGLAKGTPVISAGGDQQCAALGAGVIENGTIQATTGTGSFIIASSDTLQLDPKMRAICNVSAVPNKYVLESSILTTSTITNWFSNNFYLEDKETSTIERMMEDAAASPVGSKGLISFPHFQGRGSPDWNPLATGMFFNVTLESSKGDFVRAILESIALEISENIDVMKEILGSITSISVAGGLTKSSLFNQIQTDVYKQQISLPANHETTSLGAWVSAAVALDLFTSYQDALKEAEKGTDRTFYQPIAENVNVYQRIKTRRTALYESLLHTGIYEMFREEANV